MDRLKTKVTQIIAWIRMHPRKAALIGAGIFLLVAGGGLAWWKLKGPGVVDRNLKTATTQPEPPKPLTKPSPLTGVEVTPELADRPISAVVIENHPDARPQSGLSQAGVVYESIAEGGITRYLAFWLENRPGNIGPIRSLRPYHIDWGLEFNSPVAHVGGSHEAITSVGPLGLKDMNQFYNGANFFRAGDRHAPHNLYSNSDLLDALMQRLGFYEPSKFEVSPRKADAALNPPTNPVITVDYSGGLYAAQFRYDPAANDYLRFNGGAPDIDRNTGAQIRVKNVVVEFMPTSYDNVGHAIMGTLGSNRALVFRDGGVVDGRWVKPERKTRTQLLDPAGTPIPLNVGVTWYAILPLGRGVTY